VGARSQWGGGSTRVNTNNVSEYKVNSDTVTFAQYTQLLAVEKILVKARNFLVFQARARTDQGVRFVRR
jgi:chromosome segregation ATPase